MARKAPPALPEIPLIDLGEGGPLALLEAARERAETLLATGGRMYPGPAIRLADRLSRRWLARSGNPYLGEIAAIAHRLEAPGAYFLNVSYEWGCTSSVRASAAGHSLMLRILDWPFDGLGANLVAARFESPAGVWINATWPGFAGVVQAMAPGRFAAAFNQAPLRRRTGLFPADWALERMAVWARGALPPAHLLRRVFESCPDYAAARRMLIETPIALPAIFTLSGCGPEEGCIIERLAHRAFVFESPHVATNHWQTPGLAGRNRGYDSETRCRLMSGQLADAGEDFAWLKPPILNPTTRLAMAAEAGAGRLTVIGFEAERPATARFRLQEAENALRQAG